MGSDDNAGSSSGIAPIGIVGLVAIVLVPLLLCAGTGVLWRRNPKLVAEWRQKAGCAGVPPDHTDISEELGDVNLRDDDAESGEGDAEVCKVCYEGTASASNFRCDHAVVCKRCVATKGVVECPVCGSRV